jgi:hypothetical protein
LAARFLKRARGKFSSDNKRHPFTTFTRNSFLRLPRYGSSVVDPSSKTGAIEKLEGNKLRGIKADTISIHAVVSVFMSHTLGSQKLCFVVCYRVIPLALSSSLLLRKNKGLA